MKLTRDLYIPCIDTSAAKDLSKLEPIDLSTIFEMSWNPQEETYGYICYKNDTTEVDSYQPELPQEIVLDSSNKIYAFMIALAEKFPVGSDANVPVVLCLPDASGAVTKGWAFRDAIISIQSLNTVDGKLTFTLKLNGEVEVGTVAVTGTGASKAIVYTAPVPEG